MNSREGLSYKHVQTEKLMNTIPPFKSRLFLVSLTLQSVCGLLFQFSTLAQKQERSYLFLTLQPLKLQFLRQMPSGQPWIQYPLAERNWCCWFSPVLCLLNSFRYCKTTPHTLHLTFKTFYNSFIVI